MPDAAVILAGGSGSRRRGSVRDKVLEPICGVPAIMRSFGAFVEILPGKDGLLHISEIANRRFETMEQTGLKEGDMIEVKLIGLDPKNGKLKLSRKALLNGKKE